MVTLNGVDNFPLQVTPLPDNPLLPIGQVVPDISFHDEDDAVSTLFDRMDPEKPTVLVIYSSWNTLAQEVVNYMDKASPTLLQSVNIIPISTMEPDNVNTITLGRGDYQFEFLKPADIFFQDYMITSLPTMYLIDKNRQLVDIIIDPLSPEAFETVILDTLVN